MITAAARLAFVTPLGLATGQWLLLHPEDLGELRKKLKATGLGSINGILIKPSLDTPKGEARVVRAYSVK